MKLKLNLCLMASLLFTGAVCADYMNDSDSFNGDERPVFNGDSRSFYSDEDRRYDYCDRPVDYASQGQYYDNGCNRSKFRLYAEALYMQPCENVNIALSSVVEDGVNELLILESVDRKWSWGYRVGVYSEIPCTCWGLGVEYTHLTNTLDADAFIPEGVDTSLISILNPGEATSIFHRNKLEYNVLDVVTDFHFNVCCDSIELRPYSGFRAVWIDRKISSLNFGPSFLESGETSDSCVKEHLYGLVAGFAWKYCFCGGFNFFGRAAGSVATGETTVRIISRSNVAIDDVVDEVVLGNDEFFHKRPCHSTMALEGKFGLGWDQDLCGWMIGAYIAYETTHWVDLVNPVGSSPYLTVRGLSLGLAVGF